ncbi:hypothetical protein FHW88_002777 [Mucilaginibacter sp. SG538B]|uniref:hypothetical protein n=1 Tax=Mucilaginibacter sp. SG538B TaxID=2587021 RepID=UPI00159E6145|nr:hypothetical protein [Mucilaginibacter sp. SG538B]NVM64488.1 hypothetical protein [Mucilaginibacter sp. SG538B]
MATLNDINLSFNPFKDTTANKDNQHMVWASMKDVKSRIERSYQDCIANNSKQIILNWGPWGGGKTFSAFYFIKEKANTDNIQHIYIKCPKEGTKAADELFSAIIDSITFDNLNQHIKALILAVGEEALIEYLAPKATKEYAKAIALIGSEDAETVGLMNRFLFSGLSKTELKKLGLARDIVSDSDSAKFLTGILACYTGTEAINNGRIVIWLDEMEDLIYYAPKNYKVFSQLLRDLMDNIPDRLLFFMNFTLAEGQETVIQVILGEAIWSRVTKRIRYVEFSEADGLEYITELLAAAKTDKEAESPFNAEIAQLVVNTIPANDLTPREINKAVNSLISYSMEHDLHPVTTESFNEWSKDHADNLS